MKISKYIEKFQEIIDEYGDMEMVSFRESHYNPSEDCYYEDRYTILDEFYFGYPKIVYKDEFGYSSKKDLKYEKQYVLIFDVEWIPIKDYAYLNRQINKNIN